MNENQKGGLKQMNYYEEQKLIKENLYLSSEAIFWKRIARMNREELIDIIIQSNKEIDELKNKLDSREELGETHE